jgi:hypothetical protein
MSVTRENNPRSIGVVRAIARFDHFMRIRVRWDERLG